MISDILRSQVTKSLHHDMNNAPVSTMNLFTGETNDLFKSFATDPAPLVGLGMKLFGGR